MSSLEEKCIKAGLRMTQQRGVILKVLDKSSNHPSVEDIYNAAKKIDSSIGMATVYRTLGLLEELNLVTRHDFKEGHARYEATCDHHDHLIDVDSGKVVEFYNEDLEQLQKKIARELGYDLIDHRLDLYGRKKTSI